MRILLQRVQEASVTAEGETVGSIGRGYLLFVGILDGDTDEQGAWLAQKIAKLRLFDGSDGTINDRSLLDIGGGALVISQFTLAGRTDKGNRPDYTRAAPPEYAKTLYESFVAHLRAQGIGNVDTGRFGAHMQVQLVNDGPVTLLLER